MLCQTFLFSWATRSHGLLLPSPSWGRCHLILIVVLLPKSTNITEIKRSLDSKVSITVESGWMIVDSDVDACMICVGKIDCSESDLIISKFKSYGANEWVWSACRWHNKSSDLWRLVVRVDVDGWTSLLRYLSGLRVVVVRFDDYKKKGVSEHHHLKRTPIVYIIFIYVFLQALLLRLRIGIW